MGKCVKILIVILCLALAGCEHRPLEDVGNMHYVRVYVNDAIKNLTYGHYRDDLILPDYHFPTVLRVILCDPYNGKVISENYLQNYGEDEEGKYIDGYIIANPGRYNFMVYSFDMESTFVANKDDYFKAKAYTGIVQKYTEKLFPSSKDGDVASPIVNESDHLFVALQENMEILHTNGVDTLYNNDGEYFMAESIVKTYYIQVGVKGVEHVMSSVAILSGMAGSKILHNSYMDEDDSVNVYFEMKHHQNENIKQGGSSVIYSLFHTFGKLPNVENHYKVIFSFVISDGRMHADTLNITPLFDTDLVKNEQWILIDEEIEIPPPGQIGDGGLSPDVEDWKDENNNIDI